MDQSHDLNGIMFSHKELFNGCFASVFECKNLNVERQSRHDAECNDWNLGIINGRYCYCC